jgi:aspartyl-tRNA(Asn)/glutamyl-tRNA(Gln) amidotransferase subunit A
MDIELTQLTISQAAGWISRGELSPVELTRAYLERTGRLNPRLNCFITIIEEAALADAYRAQDEIRSGLSRGFLHGIPLALKDLYETAGVRTTHGSTFFTDFIPQADAYVVQKLKAAGMVLMGKTNMHEIALGVTNVNPHYGASCNPWDTARITGGSSGGSAAALAAGLCMGSLGSDTGGSIRIPASLCGVVGLKPTFGRVSLRGVIPLSWNLDHAGPMTRCVRDTAIMLAAIAGYDPEDPVAQDIPVDDYLTHLDSGVKDWRIAMASDAFFAKCDEQVSSAIQAAAQIFRDLGAHVEPVEFPEGYAAASANASMVTSDAAAFHQERLQSYPEGFGADVLERLQGGAAHTSSEYCLVRREQSRLRRLYERFFEQYDVLLTPTTPVVAPWIEGPDAIDQARLLTRFTAPFNLTGLPALSLPCGFSNEGLPVGLQLISRPWAEAALLQAGQAYEQATGWHLRRTDMERL